MKQILRIIRSSTVLKYGRSYRGPTLMAIVSKNTYGVSIIPPYHNHNVGAAIKFWEDRNR